MREQKAGWIERKTLKEKLLAFTEHDLIGLLNATGMKLRGANPQLLDLIGYGDNEWLKPEQLR